jgi:hypothetical protein
VEAYAAALLPCSFDQDAFRDEGVEERVTLGRPEVGDREVFISAYEDGGKVPQTGLDRVHGWARFISMLGRDDLGDGIDEAIDVLTGGGFFVPRNKMSAACQKYFWRPSKRNDVDEKDLRYVQGLQKGLETIEPSPLCILRGWSCSSVLVVQKPFL